MSIPRDHEEKMYMAINNIPGSGPSIISLRTTAQHNQEEVSSSRPIQLSAPDSSKPLQKIFAADMESVSNALLNEVNNRCSGLDERIHHGWGSLSGSQRKLNKLKRADKILNAHVRPLLEKYPKDTQSGKIRQDIMLSNEDVAKMSRALEVATKALPTGELRELTGLLGQYLKTSWKQQKVDELKESILKELEPQRRPETFRASSQSINAKLGIGTPVIEVNNHTLVPISASTKHVLGLGKKTEILTDPEGLVFINHHTIKNTTNSANAKLELGKIVNANINGGVKVAKDDVKLEMFGSIEELVEKRADDSLLSHANRDEYKGIAKFSIWDKIKQKVSSAVDQRNFPSSSELDRLENDQQHMVDNKARLNELLKNVLHFQDVDISAPTPSRARGLVGHSSTTTVTAAVKGGAAAAGVSGNINISASRSLFDFHVYAPAQFSDAIEKNAKRLEEVPQELMQHAQDALDLTEAGSPQRQQAAVAKLVDLNTDLKRYYDVVQTLDGLRHRHKTNIAGKNNQQQKSLVNEKHQLENKWQAIGRHNFLQTLSASHALLSINAKSAEGEFSEQATSAIKNAADSLRNPKIQYDKGRLTKSAAFQKDIVLQNRSTKVTAGADLGGYGVSGSLSYSREWLNRIHPSRVRQGDYVNKTWTVTGNVSANSAVNQLANRLQSSTGDNGTIQDLSDILTTADSTDLSYSQSRSKLTREFRPEYRADKNYSGDKDYHTQFTRTTKTTATKVMAGGTGPVAPGFNVGASASYERTQKVTLDQKIGTDDLAYVLSILNRMDKNKAVNPKALEGYYDENKAQFGEMFTKMGQANSSIYQEAQYFLDELIERAPDSDRERSLNALTTICNGEQRVSQKDRAFTALANLTSGKTENNPIPVLREAVEMIPWNQIQEFTPSTSTMATLGFSGKTVFGKKVIPGEKPTTKQEKAEKALSILEKAVALDAFNKHPGKSSTTVKDAVKTLTRLFNTLDNKAGFDKAKTMLTEQIKQAPLSNAQRDQIINSLNTLVTAQVQTGDSEAANANLQTHFEILEAFIRAHSQNTGPKDAAHAFKEHFNTAMADYYADPSSDNLASAKAAFFDFHSRQMTPWNEAHVSTWVDVPFTRTDAERALDTGTRVLKKVGLHSRVSQQRQMRSQTSDPVRNGSTSPSSDSLSPSAERATALPQTGGATTKKDPVTLASLMAKDVEAEKAESEEVSPLTLASLMAQEAEAERAESEKGVRNKPVSGKK